MNQEARLRALVNSKPPKPRWSVTDVYREEGRSGKDLDRPELQRLLADVRRGRINTVLVVRIDRITRSLQDFFELHKTFKNHGADFISIDEHFDTTTATGRAMLKISLVFAELERERTSERTKEAMSERAKRGLWNGGQLVGYRIDADEPGVLKVDPDQKVIVDLIFAKYLELGSARKVAAHMNECGYRAPSFTSRRGKVQGAREFISTTIDQIVSNVAYLGLIRYKDREPVPGRHQPIVDKETFDAVQALRRKNTLTRRNAVHKTAHVFSLEGLVRCGGCGMAMTPHWALSRGERYFYYRCVREMHRGKDACTVKSVSAPDLEKMVLDRISQLAGDEAAVKAILDSHGHIKATQTAPLEAQLDGLRRELKRVVAEGEALTTALAQGSSGRTPVFVLDRLTALDERRRQLQAETYQLEFRLQDLDRRVDDA